MANKIETTTTDNTLVIESDKEIRLTEPLIKEIMDNLILLEQQLDLASVKLTKESEGVYKYKMVTHDGLSFKYDITRTGSTLLESITTQNTMWVPKKAVLHIPLRRNLFKLIVDKDLTLFEATYDNGI